MLLCGGAYEFVHLLYSKFACTKELTYLGFAKEFATIENPLQNNNITIEL
jgi:hypothetical protein